MKITQLQSPNACSWGRNGEFSKISSFLAQSVYFILTSFVGEMSSGSQTLNGICFVSAGRIVRAFGMLWEGVREKEGGPLGTGVLGLDGGEGGGS